MNIFEGGTKLPEGRRIKRPEVDHIFPQSKLRLRGISEEQINDYANLRLISHIYTISMFKNILCRPNWCEWQQKQRPREHVM
ncbi:MAG: hypothetical protein A2136_00285 [Chloroflexi bacterium RBG_16_54_11]|nr:MAG: hypothetical protein A2136_00285 [Chloroflexi bacterium RBG_16_54_11]